MTVWLAWCAGMMPRLACVSPWLTRVAPWLACVSLWLACVSLHAEEVLYRLPWTGGLPFTSEVGPGQVFTPHSAASNRHAVDFALREGTSVLAARGGVVVAT